MEISTQQHFLADTTKRTLRKTFERVWEEFPYYRRQFEQNKLKPTDDPIALLNDFPLLDRNGYLELQKDIYHRLRNSRFLTEYTSGTTGQKKIRFVTQKDEKAEEELCVRFFKQCGLNSSDRVLALDIDSPEIYLFYSRALARIGVQNFSYLNFVDSGIVGLEPLLTFRPTVVLSIPSVLARCKAQLLQISHSMGHGNLRKILYIAENIDPELRYTLSEEMGLEVFSFYGSTEIGSMAGECRNHEGIHIYNDSLIPTLIDPIDNGEHLTGKVAWTTFHFSDQPLIKYVNGDIISIAKKACTCGSNYPLMIHISRENDYFSIYGHMFNFHDFAKAIRNELGALGEFKIIITSDNNCDKVTFQLPDYLVKEKKTIIMALNTINGFSYFLKMQFIKMEISSFSKQERIARKENRVMDYRGVLLGNQRSRPAKSTSAL